MDILFKIFHRIAYYIKYFSKGERCVSYGEDNKDKVFYVIGVDYVTQGLFAIVKNVLVHIEYALEKGYIPVVDMQNFSSQFNNGNQNVWEYFFCQPCGYDLQSIKNSKNIILSRNIDTWLGHSIFPSILDENNRNRHLKLKGIFSNNIRPSKELTRHVETLYNRCVGDKKNILGVLCRGTDYTQKKPHGHPVQPTFEQLIQKIDDYLNQYVIDYIFVATEDEMFLEKFKLRYDSKILYVDQKRFSDLKVDYISEIGIKQNDLVKLNMDYYASLYILSKCDYLIAGRTAGTIGVSFMTNGHKDQYYFRLGNYS